MSPPVVGTISLSLPVAICLSQRLCCPALPMTCTTYLPAGKMAAPLALPFVVSLASLIWVKGTDGLVLTGFHPMNLIPNTTPATTRIRVRARRARRLWCPDSPIPPGCWRLSVPGCPRQCELLRLLSSHRSLAGRSRHLLHPLYSAAQHHPVPSPPQGDVLTPSDRAPSP